MRCWAQTVFVLVVVVLGSASMIGACGQKGPLYLPEEPVVDATAAEPPPGADVPAAAPAPDTAAPRETP
jgi:predicted small lipoprotein YifL